MCKPHPPQQHKRPSISLRGSTEQRESGATIAPTQAPRAPLCWAASLQVTHLAPEPQTQGERGQEKGASAACFPSAQPRNFFCAEQGLAHSSAEQLPHCCAVPSQPSWHRQLRGQGGGHRDLKGCAVLRAVWQNTVHVQSNTGHDRSD